MASKQLYLQLRIQNKPLFLKWSCNGYEYNPNYMILIVFVAKKGILGLGCLASLNDYATLQHLSLSLSLYSKQQKIAYRLCLSSAPAFAIGTQATPPNRMSHSPTCRCQRYEVMPIYSDRWSTLTVYMVHPLAHTLYVLICRAHVVLQSS